MVRSPGEGRGQLAVSLASSKRVVRRVGVWGGEGRGGERGRGLACVVRAMLALCTGHGPASAAPILKRKQRRALWMLYLETDEASRPSRVGMGRRAGGRMGGREGGWAGGRADGRADGRTYQSGLNSARLRARDLLGATTLCPTGGMTDASDETRLPRGGRGVGGRGFGGGGEARGGYG